MNRGSGVIVDSSEMVEIVEGTNQTRNAKYA